MIKYSFRVFVMTYVFIFSLFGDAGKLLVKNTFAQNNFSYKQDNTKTITEFLNSIENNELSNVNYRYLDDGIGAIIVFHSYYYSVEFQRENSTIFTQITKSDFTGKMLEGEWITDQEKSKIIYDYVLNLGK